MKLEMALKINEQGSLVQTYFRFRCN